MDIQIAMTILENGYKDAKILVPASSFKLESESRLLIPFTSFDKIGFMNKQGEVVVEPQYTMYYGDCYSPTDLIKVSINEFYGFLKNNSEIDSRIRPVYGLINYKGEIVLDTMYRRLELAIGCGNLATVQNKELKYGIIDLNGNVIVPFGRYDYIDGFDRGFARVLVNIPTSPGCCKYGIINEQGEEVLPVEYDDIWNFYGKPYDSIVVVRNGVSTKVSFSSLKPRCNFSQSPTYICDDEDDYGTHYGEYEGSYAQDVMGYSDDVINDAFEGDPDAYWNID